MDCSMVLRKRERIRFERGGVRRSEAEFWRVDERGKKDDRAALEIVVSAVLPLEKATVPGGALPPAQAPNARTGTWTTLGSAGPV